MEYLNNIPPALALGGIYALIALGYTMIYGIMKLINFAHGEIVMIGGYVTVIAMQLLGVTPNMSLPMLLSMLLLVLVASMVVSSFVGVIMERFAYRPLRNAPTVNLLITAIGVSILIQNLVRIFIGAKPQSTEKIVSGTIPNTNIQYVDLTIILMSGVLLLLLMYIVYRTKMGKAMRAVSQDTIAATLMGINVNRIVALTFALGSSLAAVAGFMYVLKYSTIEPTSGTMIGLKAFISAVLGGIGSLPGAMVGAFLIGGIETFTNAFGYSSWSDAVVFIILIIILLVKPAGLFGKNVKEKV
ncbi:MAG: branched-chain amino acid ABC transporter permease [Culicoidibacterales bacterium]